MESFITAIIRSLFECELFECIAYFTTLLLLCILRPSMLNSSFDNNGSLVGNTSVENKNADSERENAKNIELALKLEAEILNENMQRKTHNFNLSAQENLSQIECSNDNNEDLNQEFILNRVMVDIERSISYISQSQGTSKIFMPSDFLKLTPKYAHKAIFQMNYHLGQSPGSVSFYR